MQEDKTVQLSNTDIDNAILQALKFSRQQGKLQHMNQEEYNNSLKKQYPKDKCIISAYVASKGEGKYTQIRYRKTKYYLHRIAALQAVQSNPPNNTHSSGFPVHWEASHWYCHNAACFNPEHVCIEASDINKSRMCCKLFGSTEGYKCPHKPICKGCTGLCS